jgi:TatD DNase family protein
MNVRYIDVHCHVQFDQYDEDREDLIAQIKEQKVAGIVVGCDLESSQKAISLAQQHEHLYASVGLHPTHAEEFEVTQYRALAEHEKVVAIGECGLDYFRPTELTEALKEKQKSVFKQHIALAAELQKPLIIHARPSKGTQDAYHDLIVFLQEAKQTYPDLRGDIHFFVGGIEEAEALRALDFTLSFTAVITFAHDYDEMLRAQPLTAILSETDAPYIAPIDRRGKRNDPLAVITVVSRIAEIRSEEPEIVRTTLLQNALKMFPMPGLIAE